MSKTHELITSPVPSMMRLAEGFESEGGGIELDTARINIFRKIVHQP